MKVGLRGFLAGMSIVCVLLTAPLWVIASAGAPLPLVIGAGTILGVAAVLLAWAYFRVSLSVRTAPDLGDKESMPQEFTSQMSKRVDEFEARITPRQAARFATMLTRPYRYFERISERVEPLTRALEVSTTLTVSFQLQGETSAVVPVLMSTRGSLAHGLRFTDAAGQRLSSLPQSVSTAYALAVLRVLVHTARGSAGLATYRSEIEPTVAGFLISEHRPAADDVRRVTRAVKLLSGKRKDNVIPTVDQLIRRLSDDHPICLELSGPEASQPVGAATGTAPVGVRVRLTARQRFHPDYAFRASHGRYRSRLDAIRVAFGIRQGSITVPIASAARTDSYHLEVIGPHRTYLARQDLVGRYGASVEPTRPLRVAPRRGQRHAHLHSRRYDGALQLAYATQFYERMPGSMAVAAAGALSVAVLCGLGLVVTASTRVTGLIGSWEYGAIILAFPVAASLWVGVDGDRQLNQGVLLSRVSTLASIALACIGATINVLRVEDPAWWFALTVVAVVNALAALTSWVSRARLESSFISHADPILSDGAA